MKIDTQSEVRFLASLWLLHFPESCANDESWRPEYSGRIRRPQRRRQIDTTGYRGGLRRQCSELSGGEQRWVALACALASTLDLLILDEPTTGLDFGMQERVWSLLEAARERGAAAFCVTYFGNEMNAAGARLPSTRRGTNGG
ncbi:AAA family ATPase [Acidithiobacillus ferrooxidans]|uniref:AAA family ATPase n=1 Tax=Acidithiobacillus ferrooxidans TaxID=920 RepID=UPI001C07E2C6|nr:AAA family ATPase [Acidithiobacillus ferrooxidans]